MYWTFEILYQKCKLEITTLKSQNMILGQNYVSKNDSILKMSRYPFDNKKRSQSCETRTRNMKLKSKIMWYKAEIMGLKSQIHEISNGFSKIDSWNIAIQVNFFI